MDAQKKKYIDRDDALVFLMHKLLGKYSQNFAIVLDTLLYMSTDIPAVFLLLRTIIVFVFKVTGISRESKKFTASNDIFKNYWYHSFA